MTEILKARQLSKHFDVLGGPFGIRKIGATRAVEGVDLTIHRGEILGLVGESGCGKSTLGRLLIRLIEPTSGTVQFYGSDGGAAKGEALRALQRRPQMIFQDPYGSLNPRMRVDEIVTEPLRLAGKSSKERRERAPQLLKMVGLSPEHGFRYAHQFSGGQRQRIGIARALALDPDFVICDEPVSGLDVSVQGQIVNLLRDLRRERDISYLFISHDLRVVRHIADRVAVMYLGRIVELGPKDSVYDQPLHPYTKALLAAVPHSRPGQSRKRVRIKGEVPSAIEFPAGCPFHTRCPMAEEICRRETPELKSIADREIACHLAADPA